MAASILSLKNIFVSSVLIMHCSVDKSVFWY